MVAAVSGLTHPVVVLAIVTLLVNDHVLKGNAPGWLTGKLSDFAGLLFFPFLATAFAAVLHLPRPAFWGFGLTALWFTAIKTMPWAATATESIYPWSTRIVVDPTDLIALVSLLPGALIWQRISSNFRSGRQAHRSFGLALVGLAAMATMATSVENPPSVGPPHVVGDDVYVRTPGQSYEPAQFVSHDAGATWEEVEQPTPEIVELLQGGAGPPDLEGQDARRPCLADKPNVCYMKKLTYYTYEESSDGGLHWEVVLSEVEPPVYGVSPEPYLEPETIWCFEREGICQRNVSSLDRSWREISYDLGTTWALDQTGENRIFRNPQALELARCDVDRSNLCYRPADIETKWVSSNDGGITWDGDVVDELPTTFGGYVVSIACLTASHCFRAFDPDTPDPPDPSTRLEESTDGGKTWGPSWTASPRFNDNVGEPSGVVVVGDPPTLIASLGTDGLLRRTPDGEWETIGIGRVRSAAATTDLEESMSMTVVVGLTVALMVFGVLLMVQAWDKDEENRIRPRWAGLVPLVVGAAITPLYLAATASYPYWFTDDAWIGVIFILLPLAVLIGSAGLVQVRSEPKRVLKDLSLGIGLGLLPVVSSLGIWDYI